MIRLNSEGFLARVRWRSLLSPIACRGANRRTNLSSRKNLALVARRCRGQRQRAQLLKAPRPSLTSERCRTGSFSGTDRHRLSQLPSLQPNPALHVAGRANKVVLQFHLGQAAIARVAQTVRPDQFALRALDSIAMFHALLEGRSCLFLPPRLQDGMILANHQPAMPLVLPQPLPAQSTAVPQRA